MLVEVLLKLDSRLSGGTYTRGFYSFLCEQKPKEVSCVLVCHELDRSKGLLTRGPLKNLSLQRARLVALSLGSSIGGRRPSGSPALMRAQSADKRQNKTHTSTDVFRPSSSINDMK